MGLIHGLTNLGGAMLAILAGGTNTEKEAIRYMVAHYYLAFSTIQLFLLAIVMEQHNVLITNLPIAGVSAVIYLSVGNRLFTRANNSSFNFAMTIFMALFGFVVVLNFFGQKIAAG